MGVITNGAALGYTGPAIPSLVRKDDPIFKGGRADPGIWGEDLDMSFQTASWIGKLVVGAFVCMERVFFY